MNRCKITFNIACLVAMSHCLTGCATMNHAESGALVGTGLGAVAGSLIGGQSGHAEGGALIGAVTGAIAGSMAGQVEDSREERDAAFAYANHEAQMRQAVTNADIAMMTQSGIGDDVIISSVRTRGGNFDLSPGGIVNLKAQGVSDRVILALQKAPSPSSTIVVPAKTRTEVVYVNPPPPVGVGVVIGPRYHRPPPRRAYIHYGHHYRW